MTVYAVETYVIGQGDERTGTIVLYKRTWDKLPANTHEEHGSNLSISEYYSDYDVARSRWEDTCSGWEWASGVQFIDETGGQP